MSRCIKSTFIVFVFALFSGMCMAGIYLEYALNFHSDSDSGDAQVFKYNRMNNSLFIGSSIDNMKKYIFGVNFASWNKSQKKGDSDTETTVSLLEVGPKFLMYFTQERTWFASLTYNFSTKGKAKEADTDSEVEGTSIMAALGYHIKMSKKFALGASLNYHSTTLTSRSSSGTKTDVSDNFTSINPMFEAVLRY